MSSSGVSNGLSWLYYYMLTSTLEWKVVEVRKIIDGYELILQCKHYSVLIDLKENQ